MGNTLEGITLAADRGYQMVAQVRVHGLLMYAPHSERRYSVTIAGCKPHTLRSEACSVLRCQVMLGGGLALCNWACLPALAMRAKRHALSVVCCTFCHSDAAVLAAVPHAAGFRAVLQAYPFVARKVLRDDGSGTAALLRDLVYDEQGKLRPGRLSALLQVGV